MVSIERLINIVYCFPNKVLYFWNHKIYHVYGAVFLLSNMSKKKQALYNLIILAPYQKTKQLFYENDNSDIAVFMICPQLVL